MHHTQQFVILLGIVIVLIMGIYPPWTYVDDRQVTHSMGYAPIWRPPIQHQDATAELFGIKLRVDSSTQQANAVDYLKLLMQITILSLVTGGLVVMLKRPAA